MSQNFIDSVEQTFTSIDFLSGCSWASLNELKSSGSVHRLKMKAGATIPPHKHPADEHVILISGELITGGRKCLAGCYWITPANTRQGPHEAITDVELITIRLGPMGTFEQSPAK